MRFIIMHKTNAHWEAGAIPTPELIGRVGGLLGQLKKAGVLLAGEGLRASSEGVRVTFSAGTRTPQVKGGSGSVQRAILYAGAGDLDSVFEHLDRAIDDHDPALVHLAVAPQWDSLRGDPRFNQRLARMKLAPFAKAADE